MDKNHQRSISIAVSFGDVEALERLGSGCTTLQCPECGQAGRRWGNPGAEMRFDGFEPLSSGGKGFVLARCLACRQEVLLPHRAALPGSKASASP